MKKIIIIGCPGSVKTTLAKLLEDKLSLPVIHLDKLQWKGNWETVRGEEFDNLLKAEMEKEAWIIDGNYNRTIPMRLKYCDTVIYLDYHTAVSFSGALTRLFRNYGKVRQDMGGNCYERFDPQFFWFILTFNIKNRKRYYRMLKDSEDKNVIILRSRKEAEKFLKDI